MKSSLIMVAALTLVVCCGGRVDTSSDASATIDGSDAPTGDAVWTLCTSPSGYGLCGGPNQCNGCATCADDAGSSGPNGLRPCEDKPPYYGLGCAGCPDGSVCVMWTGSASTDAPIQGECVPWEQGQLFVLNSLGTRVLYADMNDFTSDPLPEPTTCPDTPGMKLCGGACGDCPSDFCFGRSPQHPYSVCAKQTNGWSCKRKSIGGGTLGCLIFHDPQNQPRADNNGFTVDKGTCAAAAAMYPGGADCVE